MELQELYKQAIPTNARMFMETLLGRTEPFTAKDFRKEEIDEIKKMVERQLTENRSRSYIPPRSREDYNRLPNWTAARGFIPYEEYLEDENKKKKKHERDQNRAAISYGAYPDIDAPEARGWIDSIKSSYERPSYSVATSLGRFVGHDKGTGYVIEDSYDWNKMKTPVGLKDVGDIMAAPFGGPEPLGNVLMRLLMPDRSVPVRLDLLK